MIQILIVDDQRLIREGLKLLLGPDPNIEVVGLAENGQVGVEYVAVLNPDIVLMDLDMPVLNGLEATQIIRQKHPDVKILMLTASQDDSSLEKAIQAGVQGFLPKNISSEELISALHSTYQGHTQFGPGLIEKLAARLKRDMGVSNPDLQPTHPAPRSKGGAFSRLLDECIRIEAQLRTIDQNFQRIQNLT